MLMTLEVRIGCRSSSNVEKRATRDAWASGEPSLATYGARALFQQFARRDRIQLVRSHFFTLARGSGRHVRVTPRRRQTRELRLAHRVHLVAEW